VISVSQSMKIISLYLGTRRHVLENSTSLLSRANQAVQTLERYKFRLDEVSQTLAALEIEDLVTVRDATVVSQRLEMVSRIADEISGYGAELGTDGRLLALQLEELMAGVHTDRELIARDYLPAARKNRTVEQALEDLEQLSAAELLDLSNVAKALGYPGGTESLETSVSPRGYRLLSRVPRLPSLVLDRIVEHFGGLQKVLAASVDELQDVEGVGDARARSIRESLSRLAEASIIERYT
jgi:diadenylate cyclase